MQGPRLLSHSAGKSLSSLTIDDLKTAKASYDPPSLPLNEVSPCATPPNGADAAPMRRRDDQRDYKTRWRTASRVLWRHANFLGPGLIASVAYIDPGNWATDLAAGAAFGYAHLMVILLAGMMAIVYQILATRLGIVGGRDLAEQCRQSLYNRPKRRLLYRWGVLYPLYGLSEIAIIFTDLAELLGSAIAINLLVPAIPLYAGVLLTGLDVFLVLLFFNSYPSETATRSMRLFEGLIGLLVLVVLGCFIALLARVGPDWGQVFRNYLPNSGVIENGGLYAAVGIIGATVMPHALFLGSKLATIERYREDDEGAGEDLFVTAAAEVSSSPTANPTLDRLPRARSRSVGPSLHLPNPRPMPAFPMPTPVSDEDDNAGPRALKGVRVPSLDLIQRHVTHASIDIGMSLMSFALVINSAILIVAATAFSVDDQGAVDGDLFSAHQLIRDRLGTAPAYLFAIGLLLSGQCASITVTLSGQVVSEGFLHWTIKPWKRRLITRLISMIPSVVVAVAVGQQGLNTLLVASQVALSIILPFVVFPLLCFTSNPKLMTVPAVKSARSPSRGERRPLKQLEGIKKAYRFVMRPLRKPLANGGTSFATPAPMALFGWGALTLIVIANIYAVIQLGQGE